jgi:hypothetical protein
MKRALAPEWLDELPPEDQRAVASRRDLTWLNRFMRRHFLVRDVLFDCFPKGSPQILADLGGGDGSFLMRSVAFLRARWPSGHAILVDRILPSRPRRQAFRTAMEQFGWTADVVQADVFDWLQNAEADAILANLFLHHLDNARLAALFALLSKRTNVFVACEPLRHWLPYGLSRLLGLAGCNDVTRHDAPISVCAGFRDRELSALWPQSGWSVSERRAGCLSHLFIARQTP